MYTRLVIILFAAVISFGCGAAAPQMEAQAQELTASPTPLPPADSLMIAAVGDVMLGSPFPDGSRMPPNDGADLLKPVTPILTAADIAFGNLEGPITDGGISEKCKPPKPAKPPVSSEESPMPEPSITPKKPEPVRCYAFRMPTRYAKYLKVAGFDVMSLANNHAGDFGSPGRASTRRTLDGLGIKHAGSDRLKFSTAIVEVKGKRVAFVAFAHNNIVPNVNDLAMARRLVQKAEKTADIVVVSFHGGAEGAAAEHVPNQTELYFGEKRGNLPLFARTVIDAGADLVIGHGPHVLRGLEIYKGRLIAYSLGNFATYGWFSLKAETAISMILEARLAADGRFIGGKIVAVKQEGRGGPVLDPSGDAINKVRSLSNADFGPAAPKIAVDGTFLIN